MAASRRNFVVEKKTEDRLVLLENLFEVSCGSVCVLSDKLGSHPLLSKTPFHSLMLKHTRRATKQITTIPLSVLKLYSML